MMKMAASNKIPPAPRWDLDCIFPGGSQSPQFQEFISNTKTDLDNARPMLNDLPKTLDDNSSGQWVEFILKLQDLEDRILMMSSFANCLTSQNVDDSKAHAIVAEGRLYYSEYEKLKTELQLLAMNQPDDAWEKLVSGDELKVIRFSLDEMRQLAKDKMPVEMESLALELGVNGYHVWEQMYDKMAGDLRADFEEDGKTTAVSMGQLATKMSNPNRAVRAQAFTKLSEAWQSRAELAAITLNSLAGFRLSLYGRRNWKSALHEPLLLARLKQESLDAMWSAIEAQVDKLKPYIQAKKKLLGIDKFSWWDQFAPCGKVDKLYSFEEAGRFVIDNDRSFSSEMADFIEMALDKRWVEAEDRPGKAGGGYCTRFGPFKQGRIFMTYAGTYENLLTLAHELGHLYHGYILKDLPRYATEYPMTLAETASIFNEMLVTDAAIEHCSDPQEKLMLIEQNLQGAYTMYCDIYCRYLFERSFYEERTKGVVEKDRLDELMIEAQKKTFGTMLDETGRHPLFWASKLHFYISDLGFYNFPYTFGLLFAGGVYDRARKEGKNFAPRYRALLADTGSMTTEQVATKHLGVDLTKPEFWNDAVTRSLVDVDEFVRLAESS
jgi:pepF/M3 family oligoendopeptidase